MFKIESQDNFDVHESNPEIPIGQVLQRKQQAGAEKESSLVSRGSFLAAICWKLLLPTQMHRGKIKFPPSTSKERPEDLLELLQKIQALRINYENQVRKMCGAIASQVFFYMPIASSFFHSSNCGSNLRLSLRPLTSFICSFLSWLCASLHFLIQRKFKLSTRCIPSTTTRFLFYKYPLYIFLS